MINGVIAAVVGAVTGWVLNNASTIPWDRVLWIGLSVAIGAFLILTAVVKRLREVVWLRPAAWAWSMRPVSRRTLDGTIDMLHDDMGVIAREVARPIAERAIEDAAREAGHQVAMAEVQRKSDELMEQINRMQLTLHLDETHESGTHAGMTFNELPEDVRADYLPSAPRPEPRFFIRPPGESADQMARWTLENRIERSVARNVRVEQGQHGRFAFNDAAFWDDLSGRSGVTFEGRIVRADSDGGIQLVLTYLDGLNRSESVYFWIREDSIDPVEGFPDRSTAF